MMRRGSVLVLAVWLMGSGSAKAEHLTPFQSGSDLAVECQHGTEMCYAYLLGLAVGMTEACTGWGNWTAEQLRDILLKFVASNPEQAKGPRDVAAIAALKSAFGCNRY